jgi:hypothetical protein
LQTSQRLGRRLPTGLSLNTLGIENGICIIPRRHTQAHRPDSDNNMYACLEINLPTEQFRWARMSSAQQIVARDYQQTCQQVTGHWEGPLFHCKQEYNSVRETIVVMFCSRKYFCSPQQPSATV